MLLPPLQSVNWFFFWMRTRARPGVLYPGRFTYLGRRHAEQESRQAARAEDAARFNVAAAAEAGRCGRHVCRCAGQVLARMPVGRQGQALPLHGH